MAQQRHALLPPPVWFAAAWGVQRLMTRRRATTGLSRATAAAVAAGSGMLAASAVATLARAHTAIGPEHPEQSTTLVTDGPFRRTRNPLYLALTGILVSHALLRRSPAALAPAAGFVMLMDRTQIPAEERALHSRFSRPYTRYRRATPRWIGTGKA